MVISANDPSLNRRRRLEEEYEKRVNLLILHINQHLDEPLKLDDLAQVACFSPFHLHRIFSAFTGIPMGEYIRRLRMERAVLQLSHTRRPVTHIAFEAGYDSLASFSKAFRQAYGLRPSDVRREHITHLPFRNGKTELSRRMEMKPEIRTYPDRKIVYITRKGFEGNTFNKAADKAFTVLCDYMSKNRFWEYECGCLGICPDDCTTTQPEKCHYIGAFFVDDKTPAQPEGEVKVGKIDGGRFAVFTYQGPFEGLTGFWSSVYRDWLPASGEKPRDVDPFEVYLDDKKKTRPEDLRTEVHIPIV
jgi:AraC family transcriptional regulator